jgi:ABC-type xylose transport system substrate-binding protein
MPVDALILVAINPEAPYQWRKSCGTGNPVINCNVMTASQKVVSRVRCDDTINGKMQDKIHIEQVKRKGNFIVIAGVAGSSWADGRSRIQDYIAKNAPGIKYLITRYLANNDPALGLAEMEDLLQTYNDIPGVMTGSAVLEWGVAQAIDAAGKSKDIVVTVLDIFDESVNGLKDGRMDAVILQDTVLLEMGSQSSSCQCLKEKQLRLSKNFWSCPYSHKDNVDSFDFAELRIRQLDGSCVNTLHRYLLICGRLNVFHYYVVSLSLDEFLNLNLKT